MPGGERPGHVGVVARRIEPEALRPFPLRALAREVRPVGTPRMACPRWHVSHLDGAPLAARSRPDGEAHGSGRSPCGRRALVAIPRRPAPRKTPRLAPTRRSPEND